MRWGLAFFKGLACEKFHKLAPFSSKSAWGGPHAHKKMSTFLSVLGEHEKAHLGERQPLPERYIGLDDETSELILK